MTTHAAFTYHPPYGESILMAWCRAPKLGMARTFSDDVITTHPKRVTCSHCQAKMLNWRNRQNSAPMPMEFA